MRFLEKLIRRPSEKSPSKTTVEEKEARKIFHSSPEEEILRNGKIESSKELAGGDIGSATFVDIKDDGSGVFKSYRIFEGKTRRDFLGRERATYLIDLFLGFNLVPPTVIRTVDAEDGSFQEFVEDADTAASADLDLLSPDEVARLITFDAIIANFDRHAGNFLIKNNKIRAIDHGQALIPEVLQEPNLNFNKCFTDLPITQWFKMQELPASRVPNDIVDNLKIFEESPESQSILKKLLLEILDKEDVDLIMGRILAFARAVDDSEKITSKRFKQELAKN